MLTGQNFFQFMGSVGSVDHSGEGMGAAKGGWNMWRKAHRLGCQGNEDYRLWQG